MTSPRALAAAYGRGVRIAALALALPAGLGAPLAQAEDYLPGETLLGTVEIPVGRAAAPAAETPQPDQRDAIAEPEDLSLPARPDAGVMFNEALADLGAGQPQSAQRLFERVIAEDPEGALAQRARSYLADLYRAPAPGAIVRKAETPSARAQIRPAASPREALAPELRLPGEPQPDGREASLVPVSSEVSMRFIVEAGDRVFFSPGSAQLGGRARAVLAAQARFMKRRSDLYATIEGHADDQPLAAADQRALSEARAEAVRQRLIEEGVDPSRLTLSALARERPVSDCPTPDCAAQNRRAVTVLGLEPAGGFPGRRSASIPSAAEGGGEGWDGGRQGVAR